MKRMSVLTVLFTLMALVAFLIYPKELIISATKGLIICGEIIIPSLFPFTVLSIILFNTPIIKKIIYPLNKISQKLTGLNSEGLLIIIMSFIGGFPVGAKLINESVLNGKLTDKTANRMLAYCVNPGPAFIIIGIGEAMFHNAIIGYIIYFSNVSASLIICYLFSFKEKKQKANNPSPINYNISFSDIFVKSVYDSCNALIGICGFIILFSSIIGIIKEALNCEFINPIISLLEISNGTVIYSKNIYMLSFLTAFSGICVHMQILSICKSFKVKYLNFLISKIFSGIISTLITCILIKIFKISIPAISQNENLFFVFGTKSIAFSGVLIFMSLVFLITIKQNYVDKRRIM